MVAANRVCHSRRSDRGGRRNTFPLKRPMLVFLKRVRGNNALSFHKPSPQPWQSAPQAPPGREPTPVCAPFIALSFTIKINMFLKKVTGLFFYPIDLFSCVAYGETK